MRRLIDILQGETEIMASKQTISENRNNYYLYIHKNKINNKEYVGITCKEPKYRFGKNGKNYETQVFGNAIKKYGWDNFEHIILESGLSQDEAIQKEKQYIEEHKTYVPYGYNVALGGYLRSAGKQKKHYPPIYCFENKKIYEDFDDLFDDFKDIFKNRVTKQHILDCCYTFRNRIFIDSKSYHFQFYWDGMCKSIEEIETKVKNRISSRMFFVYRKINEHDREYFYHRQITYVCQCCGDYFKRPYGVKLNRKNQRYCDNCINYSDYV